MLNLVIITDITKNKTLSINDIVNYKIDSDRCTIDLVFVKSTYWINLTAVLYDGDDILFQGFVLEEPVINNFNRITLTLESYRYRKINIIDYYNANIDILNSRTWVKSNGKKITITQNNSKKIPIIFGNIDQVKAVPIKEQLSITLNRNHYAGETQLQATAVVQDFKVNDILVDNHLSLMKISSIKSDVIELNAPILNNLQAQTQIYKYGEWLYKFCANDATYSSINSIDYSVDNVDKNLFKFNAKPKTYTSTSTLKFKEINFSAYIQDDDTSHYFVDYPILYDYSGVENIDNIVYPDVSTGGGSGTSNNTTIPPIEIYDLSVFVIDTITTYYILDSVSEYIEIDKIQANKFTVKNILHVVTFKPIQFSFKTVPNYGYNETTKQYYVTTFNYFLDYSIVGSNVPNIDTEYVGIGNLYGFLSQLSINYSGQDKYDYYGSSFVESLSSITSAEIMKTASVLQNEIQVPSFFYRGYAGNDFLEYSYCTDIEFNAVKKQNDYAFALNRTAENSYDDISNYLDKIGLTIDPQDIILKGKVI